jgi:hypothetical protein
MSSRAKRFMIHTEVKSGTIQFLPILANGRSEMNVLSAPFVKSVATSCNSMGRLRRPSRRARKAKSKSRLRI